MSLEVYAAHVAGRAGSMPPAHRVRLLSRVGGGLGGGWLAFSRAK